MIKLYMKWLEVKMPGTVNVPTTELIYVTEKKKKLMINFKKEKDYTYISFDEKTQPMRK